MAKFAIHDGQTVINVITADSKKTAELITGMQVLEIKEIPYGIGWYLENSKWYAPSLYPSWIWDEASYNWQPPLPMPEDVRSVDNPNGKIYEWDESVVNWVEVQGE